MRTKRGAIDMSLGAIGKIILMILIVIILGIIFRDQITHFAKQILNIGDSVAVNTDFNSGGILG